jgi:hypothetical protein
VDVQAEQADAMDLFFRAVIEYVYVGPYRLSQFKQELDKIKSAPAP